MSQCERFVRVASKSPDLTDSLFIVSRLLAVELLLFAIVFRFASLNSFFSKHWLALPKPLVLACGVLGSLDTSIGNSALRSCFSGLPIATTICSSRKLLGSLQQLLLSLLLFSIVLTDCSGQSSRTESESSQVQLSLPSNVLFPVSVQSFVFSDSERRFVIDIGKVREERAYQVELTLENRSSDVFQPQAAKTSCSCLVGSVNDSRIEPGKIGSMFLRLATKRSGSKVEQRAVVESLVGKPIELQVKGEVVSDFILEPVEINVHRLVQGERFRISLRPQFEDVELASVILESYSGGCQVEKTTVEDGSVTVEFILNRTSKTDLLAETLRVGYRYVGEEKFRERDVTFRIRSKDVVVRPGIVRLEKVVDLSEKVILSGMMTFYNLPDDFSPSEKSKFTVRIGSADLEFPAILKKYTTQKLSSNCSFEVVLSREQFQTIGLTGTSPSHRVSGSRDWSRFSFSLDGIDVLGLKCFFSED